MKNKLKDMKQILIINKQYSLSTIQLDIKRSFPYKVKKTYFKEFSTYYSIRKKFKKLIKSHDVIILFDIFHITIDINYLLSIYDENNNNCKIFIIKNKCHSIEKFFKKSPIQSKLGILYFSLEDINLETLINFNKFLKATVQKIGRENSKNKALKKCKNWKFGRPKNKKGKSKYIKFKEIIRYRLKQGKSYNEILNILIEYPNKEKQFSISGLKYFIKTNFKKI